MATMTNLHSKLPIVSLLLHRFGKIRTAYFLGLVLLFVHCPGQIYTRLHRRGLRQS